MLQKIKKRLFGSPLAQLKDVRVVGFILFGILVLMASWSGVKVIETNYRLEQQVAQLQQEIEIAELENTNAKLRNEYFTTNEYLELQARKQYSKGLPGETLILIPKEVALQYVSPEPSADESSQEEVTGTGPQKPKYQQNLEAWRDFLLGRGTLVDQR